MLWQLTGKHRHGSRRDDDIASIVAAAASLILICRDRSHGHHGVGVSQRLATASGKYEWASVVRRDKVSNPPHALLVEQHSHDTGHKR